MEQPATASRERASDFRWCVLIPTYNNADKVAGVIEGVRLFAEHVLVVNDGSTDSTADILASLGVETVTHPVNRGKGQALRTGFSAARSRGFTHAISIDADGQHHPSDLPAMVDEARRHRGAVVVGARDMQAAGVPGRNALGGRMSDFGMKMLTGIDVRDSQSGFRVYPLRLVEGLRCWSPRFEFEVEILARANHAGADIRNVPIGVTYFPEAERVTHFRPWRDTIRVILLDLLLLLPRLRPWPLSKRPAVESAIDAARRAGSTTPTPAAEKPKLGIRPLWNRLVRDRASPIELAVAVGIGALIGVSPFYGLHWLIALFVATRWNLNVLAMYLGTQVSFPLLAPFWAVACTVLGSLIWHQSWPDVSMASIEVSPFGWVGEAFLMWLVGWPPVGLVTGVFIGLLVYRALSVLRKGGVGGS
jgi:uncharacterized protein (DUF2062 family)